MSGEQRVEFGMPGYWMHETSGLLRPSVEAYLFGRTLTASDIAVLRTYLRQWIFAPVWRGSGIAELRARIDNLASRRAIDAWLNDAPAIGVDPL